MDSRHMSHKLSLLNQIIKLINAYREEKLEALMQKSELQEDLKTICISIYRCAHLWKDTDGLLSKKNWLSIDPVSLPNINADTVLDDAAFQRMFDQVKILAEEKNNTDPFYDSLLILLTNYKNS